MRSFQLSDPSVNAEANGVRALLDNGYVRWYDGTQPPAANDPITDQVLLAEFRFFSPACRRARGGVIRVTEFRAEPSAKATGTATWFRALKADGTTPVFDGSIGTEDADWIILPTPDVREGDLMELTDVEMKFRAPKEGE